MENPSAGQAELLKKLDLEEEEENRLMWLYATLLDMGVEGCLPASRHDFFRQSLKVLSEESNQHRLLIRQIVAKQQ